MNTPDYVTPHSDTTPNVPSHYSQTYQTAPSATNACGAQRAPGAQNLPGAQHLPSALHTTAMHNAAAKESTTH